MKSKEMCDYLISTDLYKEKGIAISCVKDMIEFNKTIPIKDLVERFIEVDKFYKGKPWNIRNILTNISMIKPIEDRKEKWESKDNEQIIEKLKKLPNIGDTVYGIFRQKIIPLTITGITFNEFGITLSAKNEEELGYSAINLTEDGIGVEWYKTEEEAKAAMDKLKGKDNKDIERDIERD